MLPAVGALLGGIVSGIGSIFSGSMAAGAQENANSTSMAIADMQRQQADYYAQHGIQIRADDARRAGVNVNTALGAGAANAGFSAPNITPVTGNADGIGNAAGHMGQALTRAVTQEEDNQEMTALALKRARLENDLLESQLSVTKSPGKGPYLPSASGNAVSGQGNSPVKVSPAQVEASSSSNLGVSPGVINSVAYQRTTDGGLVPVMSSDTKQRLEDDFIGEMDWYTRNRIIPAFRGVNKPSSKDVYTPPGTDWYWDASRQAYYLDFKAKRDHHNKKHPFGWRR